MTAIRALLGYELRRHLPSVLTALPILLVLPAIHSLSTSRAGYWDGAWNLWGTALALCIVAPVLVLAMASSGWAAERSERTLDWLYARPIGAGRLFVVRALAAVAATGAWALIAVLFNAPSPAAFQSLMANQPFFREIQPGLGSLPVVAVLVVSLALGAGLFAAAIASSSDAALRLALLLTLGTAITAIWIPRLMPHRRLLDAIEGGGQSPVPAFTAVLVGGLATALLLGAWRAMARAPEDPRRLRRALIVAVPIALVTAGMALFLLFRPLGVTGSADSGGPIGDRDAIYLSPALHSVGYLTHPVISIDGSETVVGAVSSGSRSAYTSAFHRAAVTDDLGRWVLVRDTGAWDYLEPVAGSLEVVGWSPAGRHFAWIPQPGTREWFARYGRARDSGAVTLLGEDLSVRTLRLPPQLTHSRWTAAWIDDRKLLVTPPVDETGSTDNGWWLTLDIVTGAVAGPWEMAPGSAFSAQALSPGQVPRGDARLPSLGRHPAAIHHTGDGANRIAILDEETGSVRLGPEVGIAPFWPLWGHPLGQAPRRALVWIDGKEQAQEQGFSRVWLLSDLDAEPSRICTVDGQKTVRYYGSNADEVFLLQLHPHGNVLHACNTATSRLRTIEGIHPIWWQAPRIGAGGLWSQGSWQTLDRSGSG